MPIKREPVEDRIARYSTLMPTGCIEWSAGRSKSGYGKIKVITDEGVKHWRAHRLTFTLANGPIPDGLRVLHNCHNRACINVAHLYAGTDKQNCDDREKIGRTCRGESIGISKLTSVQVAEIRQKQAHGQTQTSLAVEYKMSQGSIHNIITFKTWA